MLSAVAVASLQTVAGLLVCKIHYTFAGRRGAGAVFIMASGGGISMPANTGPIHWLVRAVVFVGFMAICSLVYGCWLRRRSALPGQPTPVPRNVRTEP